MATWGLILTEQHFGEANEFMSSRLRVMPPPTAAAIFADTLQSRTVQGLACAQLLGRYDELVVAAGADGRELKADGRAVLEAATFCLHQTLACAVRCRMVVQQLKKSYHSANGRVSAERFAKFCDRMVRGRAKIPPEIVGRKIRPRKSRFNIWGEETKRNRLIVAQIRQWLRENLRERE